MIEQYKANIRARFFEATSEEIETGVLWYRQAHSLAGILARVGRISTESAAALLAVLSPMNRWEDNVSNAFEMARDVNATVRTTGINRLKAARILGGEPPAQVVKGKKVIAFWRGIADPLGSRQIAVDRHLFRAAIDRDVWFRRAAPDPWEFDNAEAAYLTVAEDLQLPLTAVSAVVWQVMRRAAQSGQRGLDVRHTTCWRHQPFQWPGSVTEDGRGRLRIFLGLGHPAANSGGWTWLPRFIVWRSIGQKLRPDEHAHHRCGVPWCCNPEHLAVSLAEFHGRYHALYTCLRDGAGRFRERESPATVPAARFGPIIGRAALEGHW